MPFINEFIRWLLQNRNQAPGSQPSQSQPGQGQPLDFLTLARLFMSLSQNNNLRQGLQEQQGLFNNYRQQGLT